MSNIKKILPNILTFSNMSLGVIAILLAVGNDRHGLINRLFIASLLIIIAALTDRFDGKVARLLDVESELGKQLDSLSDLISFGVAPVIIAWNLSLIHLGLLGYIACLIFPIAGAYRLARFNIQTFDSFYRGIPITIAGAFLSVANLYGCFAIQRNPSSRFFTGYTGFMLIFETLLAVLMVSRFRIKKI